MSCRLWYLSHKQVLCLNAQVGFKLGVGPYCKTLTRLLTADCENQTATRNTFKCDL